MTEIIDFASATQLGVTIEAVNTAIAGMTPAEAAAALNAVETGKIMSALMVDSTNLSNIISINGTAQEAMDAYVQAGGALSLSGAASQAAQWAANLAVSVKEGVTASTALLTTSLPVWAAAVAPLAGFCLGQELYEMAPEFWEDISRALLPFCYPDTQVMPLVVDATGQVYAQKEAIDALKNVLIASAIAEVISSAIPSYQPTNLYPVYIGGNPYLRREFNDRLIEVMLETNAKVSTLTNESGVATSYLAAPIPNVTYRLFYRNLITGEENTVISGYLTNNYTYGGEIVYYNEITSGMFSHLEDAWDIKNIQYIEGSKPTSEEAKYFAWNMIYNETQVQTPGVTEWQGDHIVDYTEGSIEVLENAEGRLGTYCPVQLPVEMPAGTSNDYILQPNPATITPPATYIPLVSPAVVTTSYPPEVPPPSEDERTAPGKQIIPPQAPQFNPNIDPSTQPQAEADPAEQLEEPKSEGDSPDTTFPDIIPPLPGHAFPDINPPPAPSGMGGTSGLIHIYNPTPAEMIDFGRWLWVTYADASIDKIWNNPFDGILGAFEIYCSPEIGAKEYIRSGFLVSGTPAARVSARYVSINCGSIVIPEYYANYFDYSPYSKAYVYLPFIGIVEVDVDDIVGHAVNILYHIDCYNGSCIAQITVAKQNYSNTIYQFSGNCSVEVPLSGGSQAAIKAGMMTASAQGIGSVIGGLANALFGNFAGAANSLIYAQTQRVVNMVSHKSSVQHSGTFGASYGAMGIKKPYIIVRRPVQKSVVNYNEIYGFPAHKRVRIGSCHGFLRVREIDVISPLATDEEKARIEELLKAGVYVD